MILRDITDAEITDEYSETGNTTGTGNHVDCLSRISFTSAVLKKHLAKKGITLTYFKELLMPDNSMLFYQIPGTEKAEERLTPADAVINPPGTIV